MSLVHKTQQTCLETTGSVKKYFIVAGKAFAFLWNLLGAGILTNVPKTQA